MSVPAPREEEIEVEIVLDVAPMYQKALRSILAHAESVSARIEKMTERTYVRDDQGQFAETEGGGGGDDRERVYDAMDRGQAGGRMDDDDIPVEVRSSIAPPPVDKAVWNPFIENDHNGDGVMDYARVGIDPFDVPPPPKDIPRMPNLSPEERDAETQFAEMYEADPDGMARAYIANISAAGKPGAVPEFNTDNAKLLDPNWNPDPSDTSISPQERLDRKALFNVTSHQTAHAIAKRAFVTYLDDVVAKLPPGERNILVTSGGCGAGKGFMLGAVDQMKTLSKSVAAVWDAAGDQNATENPWILQEAKARGIKATFVWVDADARNSWGNPERGVVYRAKNNGRMVDASVFADSYALGAKNFEGFARTAKSDPAARIVYLQNGDTPRMLDAMPKESLAYDRRKLYAESKAHILAEYAAGRVSTAVIRGGLIGDRIWKREGRGKRAPFKPRGEQKRYVGRADGAGALPGETVRRKAGAAAEDRDRPEGREGVAPGKAHPPAEGGAWRRWNATRALAKHFSASLVKPQP